MQRTIFFFVVIFRLSKKKKKESVLCTHKQIKVKVSFEPRQLKSKDVCNIE